MQKGAHGMILKDIWGLDPCGTVGGFPVIEDHVSEG